jgi:hypothetical protein
MRDSKLFFTLLLKITSTLAGFLGFLGLATYAMIHSSIVAGVVALAIVVVGIATVSYKLELEDRDIKAKQKVDKRPAID